MATTFSTQSSRFSSSGSLLGPSSSSTRISKASFGGLNARPPSVYGGAGGLGTRISVASPGLARSPVFASNLGNVLNFTSGSGYGYSAGVHGIYGTNDAIIANGKETMQNLNERLAAYLEKVRSLESKNKQLERQIREWYEKKPPVRLDVSGYEKTIATLRSQINAGTLANSRIILQIDNAKLAADDFRIKYESELAIRKSVEADIISLRRVLDELNLSRSGLEIQIDTLKEELAYHKKNHEEEMESLKGKLGGQVNVEVDTSPSTDLHKIMEGIRKQYEEIADQNRKDAEAWYKDKFEALNQEVSINTTALNTSKNEVTELKRTIQTLEIELQSLISMKGALEGTLQETQSRYGTQLQGLQAKINTLEGELSQLKMEMERQGNEHKILLDIKTRLEKEIETYRRLLEGEDIRLETKNSPKKEPVLSRKVKTIVEEYLDGKCVSSHVEEVREQM
ncbi:keratin, type I cytoskeletal 19-like [Protopterus annectens]|uniref:keratin, type I cytoskeletal 19-like n=1 Tax=Protopterus annectens TaxID=7888 RepID=UPI001CFB4557|nr:keratin, type I cytoskeletal 19-like [Protopterus annectens]